MYRYDLKNSGLFERGHFTQILLYLKACFYLPINVFVKQCDNHWFPFRTFVGTEKDPLEQLSV